nr:NDR1/HIN1-like protein 26 [Ipomoea batatas]
MGYLLNSDLTLLANFTNPNKKGKVEFHYAVVDLYHDKSPIASTYIQQFSMMNHEYKFQDVHLVTSQVGLSADHSQKLRTQIENGKVRFEVKGLFRVRSDLGGILKYSYWLYSHCTIMVSSPPTGILIAKRCSTKR